MTRDQAAQLIAGQPATPQGRRDAFLRKGALCPHFERLLAQFFQVPYIIVKFSPEFAVASGYAIGILVVKAPSRSAPEMFFYLRLWFETETRATFPLAIFQVKPHLGFTLR